MLIKVLLRIVGECDVYILIFLKKIVASTASIKMNSNHLKLTRSTAQPAPLLRLAAYGSLIITAFSALVALVLASYGLSAWDDAKHKLVGVRALVDRGFEVGKDIVDSVSSQVLRGRNRGSKNWDDDDNHKGKKEHRQDMANNKDQLDYHHDPTIDTYCYRSIQESIVI
ncbi:hypothetical protein PSTT_15367 [Puccinia striiformis]|uniref:Uncharacterized protein n=1 Tax=Puccinia striiformis TaxID=27350 RepID=A0A2S4UIG5_9BASI|nr:hypothetical protein PSTT_15367 [Puccinia striiformis]